MAKQQFFVFIILFTFVTNVTFAEKIPPSQFTLDAEQTQNAELKAEQAAIEEVEKELDASNESYLPGPSHDEFYITHQYLRYKGVVYPMTAFNLPDIVPGDFEADVSITPEIKSGSIVFSFIKKGAVIAEHVIEGHFNVVAAKRDKELYTFLDKSGAILSLDTGYAKDNVFKGPLPIFKVATFDTKIAQGSVTATYLTRGLKPIPFADNAIRPVDIPLDAYHTAGDFVLYGENSGATRILGLYDRNTVRTKVYTGEAVLGTLAYLQAPGLDSKKSLPGLLDLQKSETVRQATEDRLAIRSSY